MLNVRVDMGKVHCGMQTQQWNNGLVKNVTHNAHCVPLSISNVLTQSFSVLKVFAESLKR